MTICCNSAGGTVRLTIDGQIYSPRGSVTIMPTTKEKTAESNLDGTVYVTSKNVPAKIDVSISDGCGLSLEDLMNHACTEATVELDEVGRTYVLVQATVVGRPSLNPETGEISGISLVAKRIRVLNDNV
jgi:hypothetical protein